MSLEALSRARCILLGVVSQDCVLPPRQEASHSPGVQQGWGRTVEGFCPSVSPELAGPSPPPAVGAGAWCSGLGPGTNIIQYRDLSG